MKTLRDPRTGQPYTPDCFSIDTVDTLLLLVDAVVPIERIAGWSAEERQAAGDWALRKLPTVLHRVPQMPECVKRALLAESEEGE